MEQLISSDTRIERGEVDYLFGTILPRLVKKRTESIQLPKGLHSLLVQNNVYPMRANVLTFCKLRFRRMLQNWCARQLKHNNPGCSDLFYEKVGNAIGIDIAGKSFVKEEEEDETEEDEDVDDVYDGYSFEECIERISVNGSLSQLEEDILNEVKNTTIMVRHLQFMPEILNVSHQDLKAKGWKDWVKKNQWKVLQFFFQVNQDPEFVQSFFINPNTKNTALTLDNTVLANIWVHFYNQHNDLVHGYLNSIGLSNTELLTCKNATKWAQCPADLWNAAFPRLKDFQSRHKKLSIGYYGTTDSNFLNVLFYDTTTNNRHTSTSAAVKKHSCQVTQFNSKDFRSKENRDLSSLVGRWKNKRKKGLGDVRGFKGTPIDFEKHCGYFEGNPEKLAALLQNHPIVTIDLGIKSIATMVVGNCNLVQMENATPKLKSKWIQRDFSGKGYYATTNIDEDLENIQAVQTAQMEDALDELKSTTKKTNGVDEYQLYADKFNAVAPIMVEQSYSENLLRSKFNRINGKKRYLAEMNNQILSMCEAVAPEKTGAPIVIIGKPTFSATMKRQRAGSPKKIIKHLSRFFTVILVDEFNTSQRCCQCGSELERVGNSIRMYDCTGGCTFKDKEDKARDTNIPLRVNKDTCAAIGMARIFATLYAFQKRPTFYTSRQQQTA